MPVEDDAEDRVDVADRVEVDDVDVDDRLDADDRSDVDVDADEEVRAEDDPPADPRLDDEADRDSPDEDADRPLPVVEAVERDAVCQRFPPDPDDGRVMPAVGRPSSRFET